MNINARNVSTLIQEDDHEVLFALQMALENDERHQALALRTWLPRIKEWYVDSRPKSFWGQVHKTQDCWIWRGSRLPSGYGKFKKKLTHRISWELHNGPIPKGLLVCHHCDNPPCVRPDHLFLGTVKTNAQDMVRKGRCHPPRLRGEQQGRAKLTETDVRFIRAHYVRGSLEFGAKSLARKFSVAGSLVQRIVTGKSWTHVL